MNTTIFNSIHRMRELLSSSHHTVQTSLRILAAIFGGYAMTYCSLAALAMLLPWPRISIVYFSALLPGIFWLCALLWAFAAPTAQRAWRDLFALTVLCGILALVASRVH